MIFCVSEFCGVEEGSQFVGGFTAVADAVFGVRVHLGEAPVVAIGAEDRVVAEAC